ncbi:bacillithiol system redox-active protein YtxJ [Bacillus sp. B1-b2]|uniref:bacillithiol system redox-active protein YtxJ n=1 Tax=Bacillus sp. B1-b2 TaxID=2653201 RepID=UPI00126274E1|nr:bacillithiol system redox-active protein YtxJ [Bacillus sp. B1-b2]KAB7666775.1 bacillithiol system redox-active protein YtxJ [Bacillus sp. B1-b2]
MIKIDSVEQFEKIVGENKPFLLVKHSLTCPISGSAFNEYKQYVDNEANVDTYYLAVQDARPLSNYIAETYHIRHESPQALFFSNNEVLWNASHGKITVKALKEAVQSNV